MVRGTNHIYKFAIPVFCSVMAGAFAAAHPAKADDESLVYSFKGGTDGSVPAAPLLDVGGFCTAPRRRAVPEAARARYFR
jgi:hypothetical protein